MKSRWVEVADRLSRISGCSDDDYIHVSQMSEAMVDNSQNRMKPTDHRTILVLPHTGPSGISGKSAKVRLKDESTHNLRLEVLDLTSSRTGLLQNL
jgi:hypothetical protein